MGVSIAGRPFEGADLRPAAELGALVDVDHMDCQIARQCTHFAPVCANESSRRCMHIGESAAAEPSLEILPQRPRAVDLNVTRG
jgi:hypothetical protein